MNSKISKSIEMLPKSTITAILSAVIVFLVSRQYVAADTADLLSAILIALGLSVNSGKIIKRK